MWLRHYIFRFIVNVTTEKCSCSGPMAVGNPLNESFTGTFRRKHPNTIEGALKVHALSSILMNLKVVKGKLTKFTDLLTRLRKSLMETGITHCHRR